MFITAKRLIVFTNEKYIVKRIATLSIHYVSLDEGACGSKHLPTRIPFLTFMEKLEVNFIKSLISLEVRQVCALMSLFL